MKPNRAELTRRARNNPFLWRYLYNFSPTLSYKSHSDPLPEQAGHVFEQLAKDGVAVTSVDELLGSDSCYDELLEQVNELERRHGEDIARMRHDANNPDPARPKTFLFELLGKHPGLEPDSVFARFALQRPILGIANEYLRMYAKLGMYNVWHNFVTETAPRESQLWHRDRDDLVILKAFVYLVDIDEGAGPFSYIRGTHVRNDSANGNGSGKRKARYTDEQMARIVPRERWLDAVGPAGTIVFADTTGYHKGGLARERERIMYLCKFTSQAGMGRTFARTGDIALPPEKDRAFALRPRRRNANRAPSADDH